MKRRRRLSNVRLKCVEINVSGSLMPKQGRIAQVSVHGVYARRFTATRLDSMLVQSRGLGGGTMNKKLTDLVQKKQKQAGAIEGIDWDDRRNKFLDAVNGLYKQIETELDEPIKQKTVTAQRRQKLLTENYIGTYSVDDLVLVIGGEQVRFSPRGRNIVGAAGRVDVIGERGEATLILQPSNSCWEFVQTRQPSLRTVPFDDSTLAKVLQLVMRQ